MAVIKQMTGEVDVTAPGSSRRHQFHLNTKDYLVDNSLVKSLLSHKRTELVVHAQVASQLNLKSIE